MSRACLQRRQHPIIRDLLTYGKMLLLLLLQVSSRLTIRTWPQPHRYWKQTPPEADGAWSPWSEPNATYPAMAPRKAPSWEIAIRWVKLE